MSHHVASEVHEKNATDSFRQVGTIMEGAGGGGDSTIGLDKWMSLSGHCEREEQYQVF